MRESGRLRRSRKDCRLWFETGEVPANSYKFRCASFRWAELFLVLLAWNSPKITLLFVAVSRRGSTLVERAKAKLCAGILRGISSRYVGVLSRGTYQATFRTRASRSIFVTRVDSRARPSDEGRESTTFKAEQHGVIQNAVPRDESQGQARFSDPLQLAHSGTCWIYT